MCTQFGLVSSIAAHMLNNTVIIAILKALENLDLDDEKVEIPDANPALG